MVETLTAPIQQITDPNVTTDKTQSSSTNTSSSAPDDLVTRVSSVLPEPNQNAPDDDSDILKDSGFNRNQWNEMLSKLPPDQKQQLEAAYKALQTGAGKKFQKASEMIKQAESTRKRPHISELLQDPEFVQEAQSYAASVQSQQAPANSGMTNEQWSVLTDQEKSQFNAMQQNQLQLHQQMQTMLAHQHDEQLKTRYKNYDSSLVNKLQDDILNGRVSATREHLWKVLDYDDAVQRSYKLGLQDKNLNVQEKISSSSPANGFNMTQANDVPEKGKNESMTDFFKRIAQRRLAMNQNR